ncbi:MAG: LPS export ABC transporter periplasmic protein LptC [Flavobacteriales bacterium]|nr:LPS export ABC transporter periplasmic protein LptC [Flavobacteriales bacterium]
MDAGYALSRAAGALVLCALSHGCKNDLDHVAAVEVPAEAPDRITSNAEYFYSDSGHLSNRLRSGRIAEYTAKGSRRTELSEGIELTFYDRTGAEGSVLTARNGTILPDQKRMVVRDQVVFVNAKGERLETEQLIWSQDSARVHTDRPVRIARGRDIIHGVGLEANEDFSRYSIRKITGELYVDPGDTLAGDAQGP